jgi:hypothetical protein
MLAGMVEDRMSFSCSGEVADLSELNGSEADLKVGRPSAFSSSGFFCFHCQRARAGFFPLPGSSDLLEKQSIKQYSGIAVQNGSQFRVPE